MGCTKLSMIIQRQLIVREDGILSWSFMLYSNQNNTIDTLCPRSLDPIYVVTKYLEWAMISWTDNTVLNVKYIF